LGFYRPDDRAKALNYELTTDHRILIMQDLLDRLTEMTDIVTHLRGRL